jgi:hypothetical protein
MDQKLLQRWKVNRERPNYSTPAGRDTNGKDGKDKKDGKDGKDGKDPKDGKRTSAKLHHP